MTRGAFYISLLFFIVTQSILGFTLTVTTTNESCAGNGVLNFSVANTTASGTIVFYIYKLPDLVTPIATTSANNITGLTAGSYHIVAQETVGTTITTQQTDTTIINTIVPLAYTINSLQQACSTTSNISIQVTAGVGAFYEIISGPITTPQQTSNVFTGLTVGSYNIRVIDNCGNGLVTTHNVAIVGAGLVIDTPILTDVVPQNCNLVNVSNQINAASGTVIGYPLQLHYDIHPPSGAPTTTINTTLSSGGLTTQSVSQILPNYINQVYDYDLTITDACGATYTYNFIVDNAIQVSGAANPLECTVNFIVTVANFSPPYNLNFISAPAGFTGSLFNTTYPGPYNSGSITFGSQTNPPPTGTYTVLVTDNCGKTTQETFDVIYDPPTASGSGASNGCLTNDGTLTASMTGSNLATAIVISAPAGYSVPNDVTAFINPISHVLTLTPVPLGDYILVLTDNCGTIISPITITVPAYINGGLTTTLLPGCNIGKGSINIQSQNGNIVNFIITTAPVAFTQQTPFVANTYIANGMVYMNNLPAGSYSYQITDSCNFTFNQGFVIDGYYSSSSASIVPNCGSFDLLFNFNSNNNDSQSFWLQELLNSATDTWGNPDTGVAYTGGVPTATNSIRQLTQNTLNTNFAYNGVFRIIGVFSTFNDGISINNGASLSTICVEEITRNLTYNLAFEIDDVYRMPCSASGNLDVVVVATGPAPLNYSITTMNGVPFLINNGTSNIFSNLATGLYNFEVKDSCGNIKNEIHNVANLASLITNNQAPNLFVCVPTITGNETFNLQVQNAIIYGLQSPTLYTLTYYSLLSDAQNGTNAISNITNYNPATNPATVYTRLVYNTLPNCYQTSSFDLIVGDQPSINLNSTYLECNNTSIILDASLGNLTTTTYLWSNGSTNAVQVISQVGVTNLSVVATNSYGTNSCSSPPKNITVTLSASPEIKLVETVDWTETENSITVFTEDNLLCQFSLDDINYQSSNIFTNLLPGIYTVYVKDNLGCGKVSKLVWLLYYPKFFTPNGDGYNEYWRIKYSQYEPKLYVTIYDRYGKIIYSFDAQSQGWDGNYNGTMLFADDYWFVVYRADGRIHKGHFCLKR